jgi:hypothetical protein
MHADAWCVASYFGNGWTPCVKNREGNSCKIVYKSRLVSLQVISSTTSLYLTNSTSEHFLYQTSSFNMKSIIALLTLACAVSAASLTPRAALAVCNGKSGQSCAQAGQRGCENNGGHSVREHLTQLTPRVFPFPSADIPSRSSCASLPRRGSTTGSTPITARIRTRTVIVPMACASPTKILTS